MIRDTDLFHRKAPIRPVFTLSVQRDAGRLRLGDTRRRLKIYRVYIMSTPKLVEEMFELLTIL